MGGIFDDVFDDADWTLEDEPDQEKETNSVEPVADVWDTGTKAGIWNSDEPWDSEPDQDEGGAGSDNGTFDMSDFFN